MEEFSNLINQLNLMDTEHHPTTEHSFFSRLHRTFAVVYHILSKTTLYMLKDSNTLKHEKGIKTNQNRDMWKILKYLETQYNFK